MASASAASAVKESLVVVAVCVVLLLHSSAGHQPHKSPRPPPPPHCHSTGQQPPPPWPSPVSTSPPPPPSPGPTSPPPSPVPTTSPLPPPPPVPAPMPTPTLPPVAPPTLTLAPAPVSCNYTDCVLQCGPMCQAQHDAAVAKCKSDFDANVVGCYEVCSRFCPGVSCVVGSGCGFTHCPCDNSNTTSCCNGCGNGVFAEYQRCERTQDIGVGYCNMGCGDTCKKNCIQ